MHHRTHGELPGNSAGTSRPANTSACCAAPLLGSAMLWCSACGHTIPSADVSHEYQAPVLGGAR